jgi:hypothetical protein
MGKLTIPGRRAKKPAPVAAALEGDVWVRLSIGRVLAVPAELAAKLYAEKRARPAAAPARPSGPVR